ncbi:MAG: hypothetical protein Q8R00_03710 [Candidatus Nanoarchaeia archaeon]|nr:hypothetical protein [Candidatus Nanoarchaeia archaeon]
MKKGLYLGLFLLSIPLVSAEYYPVLGAVDFGSIYLRFGVFIDAVIYLFIFLGLTKMVFGPKAGEAEDHGKKIMYIGLALFLTLGLLLFQSVSGFSLLEVAGSWTVFLIFLLVILSSYSLISSAVENKWVIAGLTVLLSLIFLEGLATFWSGAGFLESFLRSGIHRWGFLVAVILLLIGGVKKFGLKASAARPEPTRGPGVSDAEFESITPTVKPPEELYDDLPARGETEEEKTKLEEEIQQRTNLIIEKIKQELKAQTEEEKKKLLDEIEKLRQQIEANVVEAKEKEKELSESFDRANFKLENQAEILKERYKILAEKYRKAREQRSPEVSVLQEQIKQLQDQIQRIGEAKTRILTKKEEVSKPLVSNILAQAWDDLMKKEPFGMRYENHEVFTRKWFEGEKKERAGLGPVGTVKSIDVIRARYIDEGVEKVGHVRKMPTEREKWIEVEEAKTGVVRKIPWERVSYVDLVEPKTGVVKKIIWERPKKGKFVVSKELAEGKTIMRARPDLISPEFEEEKIKAKKRLESFLEFLTPTRKYFSEKNREDFIIRWMRKDAPSIGYLKGVEEALHGVEAIVMKYLRRFQGEGKYVKILEDFAGAYRSVNLKFEEIRKFRRTANKIYSMINRLRNKSPDLADKMEQLLINPDRFFIELVPLLKADDALDEKQKQKIYEQIKDIGIIVSKFKQTFHEFYIELERVKIASEKLRDALAELRPEPRKL